MARWLKIKRSVPPECEPSSGMTYASVVLTDNSDRSTCCLLHVLYSVLMSSLRAQEYVPYVNISININIRL